MAGSNQVYDVVKDFGATQTDAMGNKYTANQATYNSKNNRLQLTLSTGSNSSLDLFAHELKHMYQFEIGEISLGLTESGGNANLIKGNLLFYDLTDEFEAYKRGDLFGANEQIMSASEVITKKGYDDRIPIGPFNAVNHPEAAKIRLNPQSYADKYNVAFRL
ncbi:hypothetical protein M2347_004191 [Chryseobacterium sp. H1D6B]|uniref:hypothetical protein n=1 Tax=Chryseobacterium sp. H1D6B TaxID=2940588 RepID=UPI0015C7B30D|nr:hypothetical protein [Chryseobacterium sp. H1D6B]MDH6254464.1 hypothetical protein [Chryseobacterium sp. H1D6B]